jgi:hypothetical protein
MKQRRRLLSFKTSSTTGYSCQLPRQHQQHSSSLGCIGLPSQTAASHGQGCLLPALTCRYLRPFTPWLE